jgi:hypothetical protein
MSTSILDVWISNLGDPCSITNDAASGLPHAWVVAVFDCNGRVLNWSEGRWRFHRDDPWTPIPLHTPPGGILGWWYDSIPTRNGHVEIEVPPGCYVLRGSMHTWFLNGILYGNWATDHGIVQACCGDEPCITLYAPTAPACWVPLFRFVIPLLVRNNVITAEVGRQIEQVAGLISAQAASNFEQGEFEVLQRAFEQMGQGTATAGDNPSS